MALMCKKGFLGEVLSAMLASREIRMLSSIAACVSEPAGETDELLFSGFEKSTGAARLMLRVFFVYPFVRGLLGSLTGVEARLWLRVFRVPGGSVGVLAPLALPFLLAWFSLSVPQKDFLSSL